MCNFWKQGREHRNARAVRSYARAGSLWGPYRNAGARNYNRRQAVQLIISFYSKQQNWPQITIYIIIKYWNRKFKTCHHLRNAFINSTCGLALQLECALIQIKRIYNTFICVYYIYIYIYTSVLSSDGICKRYDNTCVAARIFTSNMCCHIVGIITVHQQQVTLYLKRFNGCNIFTSATCELAL